VDAVVSKSQSMVRAWDLPTRVFHWTLVLAILSAWVSFRYAEKVGDTTLLWHRWNGYAILVLLVWRVLWGFAGSSTSRFSSFVRWPGEAIGYGLAIAKGRPRHYLGHNPLGTWMVLALLGTVGLQAGIGLFTVEHNDIAWGPLYRLVSEETYKKLSHWHLWIFYWAILPLIAIHITANALYGAIAKDPLIAAMVTGRKPAQDYADELEAQIVGRPVLRALVCLAVAAAIVFGGIIALGGKF